MTTGWDHLVRCGLVAAAGVVLVACGRGDPDPEPLAIRASEVGRFELVLVCSERISATVTETALEIRIDGIEGDVLVGDDCEGVLPLTLDGPIGDRAVVVAGEVWVELADSCPWGFLGSDSLGDRLESCAPKPG